MIEQLSDEDRAELRKHLTLSRKPPMTEVPKRTAALAATNLRTGDAIYAAVAQERECMLVSPDHDDLA